MLTVYYLAATWVQSWRLNSLIHKLRSVTDKHGSLVVHQELPPFLYSIGSSLKQKLEVNSILSDQCMNYKSGHIVDLFWYHGNKQAVSVFPKQILDVSGWISVLKRKTHLPIQFNECKSKQISKEDAIYVLIEANYLTCTFDYQGNAIELAKYGTPLAWHASDRLSLLLETDESGLSQLLLTFMQNEVTLENGIQILRILTVEPFGSPYKIGNEHTVPETYAKLNERSSGPELRNSFLDRWRAHVSMLCTFCEAVAQVKECQQDISVRHPGSGVGAVKLMPGGTAIGVSPDVLGPSKETLNTSTDESLVSAESYQNPPSEDTLTRCSSGQSSHISTEMSTAQGSTRQVADSNTTSMSSIRSLPSTPRRTVCSTPINSSTKPPNIIIFSDSPSASESVKAALELTLVNDRYVIHKLTFAEMLSTTWLDDAILVVIHGNVPTSFNPVVMNYLAKGAGSLLCLCSDFLGSILPIFHTAEVRPNELVHCSYKLWKHVPLMHHVFCYQPTPCDPKFSYDEQASLRAIPESVDVKDSSGKSHKLKIDVLGVEETWQTPSLLLVSFTDVASKIVFSQVHLETAPDQFDDTDNKREALKNSDKARLEILSDVLSSHLDLKCAPKKPSLSYSLGYFLGNHEAKQELLEKLREQNKIENNVLTNGPIKMKFCGKGVTPPPPSESMLPILIHSCPESFSTVEYFENLKTANIGRLVIFSEVMTSCLTMVENLDLVHGIAVIPYYQTKGIGRSGNTWLSPKGSAMFNTQLHIPLNSYLGQHLPILQFIATLSMVASICELPNLEELDLGIKWPNDVYVNKSTKIGGIAVKTTMLGDKAVVNLGCGINLNNKEPTVCLNDVITVLSKEKNVKISRLSYEKYFSGVFNKMEQILDIFNEGRIEEFYQLYYQYWLHSGAEIRVTNEDRSLQVVKITGIDAFGYLTVEDAKGVMSTVHPDGNTFDMMTGLISPKCTQ